MTEPPRADPEAILARIKREDRRTRGRLRIYLGAFPGVGKTFTMLGEAQRRKTYGEDVVAGFIETHGRTATAAMLQGLEAIPRKRIDYRGVIVEEMDVEAILKRHPKVCLVDELAHTNAAGSERAKRYEDVEVLLDAGIDVVSTVNIQHIESLNDTIEAITGVRVRETIPDRVLDEADEVILIDLSPEGGRARLEHGHIYPPEQAKAALNSFFRPQNLAALRELALKRTAEEVDEQLDEYMREAARKVEVEEHILVLIDHTRTARSLIRHAWRLGQGLKADLVVVYVKRDLDPAQERELARSLELAEDLNARILAVAGAGPASGLAALVASERAQHVVLAHEPPGGLRKRLFGRSLADELLQVCPDLNLHIVGVKAS